MSKEMGCRVSDELYAEVVRYVQIKKRAGSMLRVEMGHFLRDAMRHEMDRYPLSAATLDGNARKPGRPRKVIKAVLPAISDALLKKDSTPSSNPEEAQNREPKDLELYHRLEKVFLDKNDGRFTNYGKEGKALYGLISKAKARDADHAEDLLVNACAAFWSLKQGREQFWRGQPFLPSALNAGGIWDRVLESMRREELDPEVARLIREAP